MAPNVQVEPSETSPLLAKDISTPASASASTDTPFNGTVKGSVPETINGAPIDGVTDEEAVGEAEEPHNPMFEGMPEVAARLHILAPAVAIGVGGTSRLPKATSS